MLACLGCFSSADPSIRGVTDREIILGTHTDLSGVTASFGVTFVNGMRLAVDEINAAGGIHGRTIRLIVEDHQYQVPRAVQAANKLLNRDRVLAIVGALGTPMNNAVLQQQLQLGVPNLFPLTAARQMYLPLHRLKFSGFASYYDAIRAGIKWMVENRGKHRICAMYQDTDYGQETFEAARDQVAAMGMSLVEVTTHKPTDQDLTPQLTRLRAARCDLIAAGVIVRDAIIPYSAARKMGWTEVDFLSTIASYDRIVASAEGGVTEGFYAMGVVPMPDRQVASPAMVAWMDRYKAKYGEDPNVGAVYAEGTMAIVKEALDRAGRDLTADRLVAAIEGIQNFADPVAGSTVSFSPSKHQGSRAAFLAQVQKGHWVTLTGPLGY